MKAELDLYYVLLSVVFHHLAQTASTQGLPTGSSEILAPDQNDIAMLGTRMPRSQGAPQAG